MTLFRCPLFLNLLTLLYSLIIFLKRPVYTSGFFRQFDYFFRRFPAFEHIDYILFPFGHSFFHTLYGGSSSNNGFQKSSITDCYATGDVVADNPNSSQAAPVYAGGLVGYMQTANAVTRSFAAGTVSAKNASTAAGRTDRRVSVSAQGGSARYVGRVYAGNDPLAIAPNNNHANEYIFIGTDPGYAAYSVPLAVASSNNTVGDIHGADVTNSQLSGAAFWNTLGFTVPKWNFSGVGRGWPTLAALGGTKLWGDSSNNVTPDVPF